MWNVSNRNRNSYLQSKINIMNPALLNQCVETAMRHPNTTILSKRPVLNSQLIALEPQCYGPTIDPCKARLGYGLWGLPKILFEISNKDDSIQYKALNTLTDLLHNPLELYRAIYDFKVVKKLEAALLWNLPESHENLPLIDKILTNLEILATHFEGAWRLVSQCDLMDTLYDLIEKSTCTKDQPAKILQLMSSHPTVADVMLIHGHLRRIAKLLRAVDTVKDAYVHLAHLLERAPACGMEAGFFCFLKMKILIKGELQSIILKCFAFLLNTPEAHELFDKCDGVRVLYEMLKDDSIPEDTLEFVAMALKNSTINKIALWRCQQFWDLPLVLIRRAHSRTNDRLQLYCIQTLRQITVVPDVKDFVRKTCKRQIKAIECQHDAVRKAKIKLLEWLGRKKYINTEPKVDVDQEQEEKCSENVPSESENESCILDEASSDETSGEEVQIDNKLRPIAYRLDYGQACRNKIILKATESQQDAAPDPYAMLQNTPVATALGIPPNIGQRQPQTTYARLEEVAVTVSPRASRVPGGPISANIVEEQNTVTIFVQRRFHDNIMDITSKLPVDGNLQTASFNKSSLQSSGTRHSTRHSNQSTHPSHNINQIEKFVGVNLSAPNYFPGNLTNIDLTSPRIIGDFNQSNTHTPHLSALNYLKPDMKTSVNSKEIVSTDQVAITIPINQQMAAFISSPPGGQVYLAVAPAEKLQNHSSPLRRRGVFAHREK